MNDPPVAANDAVTTNANTPASGNVLANDTDVEGSALTAVLVSGTAHGTLSLSPNGSFSYTPNANYNGRQPPPRSTHNRSTASFSSYRHAGWRHSQRSSISFAFFLQYSLQYLPHSPPLVTMHSQAGCAHFC